MIFGRIQEVFQKRSVLRFIWGTPEYLKWAICEAYFSSKFGMDSLNSLEECVVVTDSRQNAFRFQRIHQKQRRRVARKEATCLHATLI